MRRSLTSGCDITSAQYVLVTGSDLAVGEPSEGLIQGAAVSASLSQLFDRGEPIDALTHGFADREDHVDDRFLVRGVRERPRVDRVVSHVAVELLHDLACLFVAAPE